MPALITPFTRSGVLDEDAHVHNVVHLERSGVTGFVLGGSTGQGPYLEAGERARLVGATRAVTRAGQEQRIEVERADQPVQVHVDE